MDRLHALLTHLPLIARCPAVLDVGCGTCEAALAIRNALPGWSITGLDRDAEALRQAHLPDLRRVCADAIHLPGLLRTRFGLVLVRHPDLFRHRDAWSRIIPRLPDLLAAGGVLLITLYAPEEVELVRAWDLPNLRPVDESALPPVDLAGHDRYPFICCTQKESLYALEPGKLPPVSNPTRRPI